MTEMSPKNKSGALNFRTYGFDCEAAAEKNGQISQRQ